MGFLFHWLWPSLFFCWQGQPIFLSSQALHFLLCTWKSFPNQSHIHKFETKFSLRPPNERNSRSAWGVALLHSQYRQTAVLHWSEELLLHHKTLQLNQLSLDDPTVNATQPVELPATARISYQTMGALVTRQPHNRVFKWEQTITCW